MTASSVPGRENEPREAIHRMAWALAFSVGFGFVEAAVVVYLRAIYYPDGFVFPLRVLSTEHLAVECSREAATVLMLGGIAMVAGTKRWERFGYFILSFGVWDLFYYVWLKIILDWPGAVNDWDVLFLLPVPWIGPVLAPLLIACIMVVTGILIILRESRGTFSPPPRISWIGATTATLLVLYTFMHDTPATLAGEMPAPFDYGIFGAGLLLYGGAIIAALRHGRRGDE